MNCVSGKLKVCLGGELDLFDEVGSDERPLTSTMFKRGMYLCIELRISVIWRSCAMSDRREREKEFVLT